MRGQYRGMQCGSRTHRRAAQGYPVVALFSLKMAKKGQLVLSQLCPGIALGFGRVTRDAVAPGVIAGDLGVLGHAVPVNRHRRHQIIGPAGRQTMTPDNRCPGSRRFVLDVDPAYIHLHRYQGYICLVDSHQHGHQHDHQHGHGMGYAEGHGDSTAWLNDAVTDAQICLPAVLDQLMEVVGGLQPGHIVDLGCGPGVGVVHLAARFPDATVSGLDINQPALDAAIERAAAEGLASRTHFGPVNFDEDFSQAAEPADVLWASMSLHHTLDPAAALSHACAMVAPGGRIALAEFGDPLTMWPDSTPVVADQTWQRWQTALDDGLAEHLGPAASNVDWLELLGEQGLAEAQRIDCPIHYEAPLAERERSWLATHLRRGLTFAEGRISDTDRLGLEALLDENNPDGIARSAEVHVRYSRTLYTAIQRSAL